MAWRLVGVTPPSGEALERGKLMERLRDLTEEAYRVCVEQDIDTGDPLDLASNAALMVGGGTPLPEIRQVVNNLAAELSSYKQADA